MKGFTHLHLHTEYSLLDGTIKIPALIEKLQELEMDSCAITDHGVLYGAFKFHSQMKKAGLKPIIGCEVYVAPRGLTDKEAGVDNKTYHMVLLAKNLEGYKNLLKIVSKSNLEGFYYKPRIDIESLTEYSNGLIATSACLGGVVAKEILQDNFQKAKENAQKFKEIYKGNFYIEIQRGGFPEQEVVNPQLIEIARELDIPLVATADAHYLTRDDSMIQEVLWCIADGRTLEDPARRKMNSQELYVKSQQEMGELFIDLPEAVENTQVIKDSIEEYDITFGRVEPKFTELPKDMDAEQYLRHLTYEGAKVKYGEVTEDLRNRLDFELKIIHEKGYDDYLLVTRMFIRFCRDNGIIVGMRGSGCGSAVAYCTDITNIEPIGWELYFERFLNPERDTPPDFDIDIADRRRDEVIQFTIDKFGEENVKQIGTFSKLQTRQAIRDVSRVLGIDLNIADRLSKMVEIVFGKAKDIDYMIENNTEFSDLIKSSPELQRMAEIVRKVAGLCRGVSTHACGIVITPTPVSDYVPLQRDSKNEGIGMTQFEMFDLEEVGLMKFDFLGLRNLAVIGDCLEIIKTTRGIEIDLLKLDPHDHDTFELIKSGNTVGIFQMESDGMRKTIKSLKPQTQEEICYLLAAYRPGPIQFIPEYVEVKEGNKAAEYLVPELESILSITNGVITYQEQVIRIAVDIAGYTMGAADILRKAMGKKKMDIMELEKPKFIQGAVSKGFDEQAIEKLWERLLQFANYGFNKAHSASYALVSFWTAYLKSHYPMEFMAALLEGDLDDFNRVVIDLQECERLGIDVLPPSVNSSVHRFTISDDSHIRFGMAAIKNVGEDAIKLIVEERGVNGNYLNFDDFLYRIIRRGVQKRVVEYLIKAGALDDFADRSQLLLALPDRYEAYKRDIRESVKGQFDLFGNGADNIHVTTPSTLPNSEPTPVHEILQWEKELLGIYLSSHPLDDLQDFFQSKKAFPISVVNETTPSRRIIVIGGLVSEIKRITTKNGDPMAFVIVEDKSGTIDMVVFPSAYEELMAELEPNKPTLFAGKINERDGRRSFILEKAKVIDPSIHGTNFQGVTFYVGADRTIDEINDLKSMINQNPGETSVRILISDGAGGEKSIYLNNKLEINEKSQEYIDSFS